MSTQNDIDCDDIFCEDFSNPPDKPERSYKSIKIAVFLFIIFIAISSDVFIEKVWPINASDGRSANMKGITIQGLTMSFSYLIVNSLVKNEYI